MNKVKNNFYTDLIWHIAGSTLPLLVGFFRVPIFTRYFTTNEYGVYGLVLITYSVLSIFLFSWLSNCIWRFYNKYKKKNRLSDFYSNLFVLYLSFSVIFLFIALAWNRTALEETTKNLIVLIFVQLLLNNLNNYFLIVHRLEEQVARYNIITTGRAVLAFGIQYYLTFKLGYRIEAIPISMIIVEAIVLFYQLPQFGKQNKISLSAISRDIIKVFFKYSIPGILSGLGLYILTSSDRYVIALYGDMGEVGIYNQVYNLCQLSIVGIIQVYFAIINPVFMRELEMNFIAARRLTNIYIKSYVLVLLPVATYMSMFAFWVANILLGPDFRVGYTMIPWIVLAMFFYGLTLFPENRLKFQEKYKAVIMGVLISSIVNIGLNFILIPRYGYFYAAITTLISYFVLMILFYRWDIKFNSFSFSGVRELLPAFATITIQLILFFIIKNYYSELSLLINILMGVIFTIIYLTVVFIFSKSTLRMLIKVYK